MAKLSSRVVSESEKLLVSLMEEANKAPEFIEDPKTKKKTLITLPFGEKLRLVDAATRFLLAQNKLPDDGPPVKSDFERSILDAATRPETRGRRRGSKKTEDLEGGEFSGDGRDAGDPDAIHATSNPGFIRDPLADTPDGQYLPVNGHGIFNGADGGVANAD